MPMARLRRESDALCKPGVTTLDLEEKRSTCINILDEGGDDEQQQKC